MKSSPLRHPARLAGASLLRLQSDARLAELAVSGHEAAFDAIVDRYRTPLARYCAGIVGPSRAEDAVQQALINAHDALQRTDEVRHLRSWLYRIAHNASLNVLRAVRDDVPLETVSLSAAESGGPAESYERSERFRATVAALQELPERQRAALLLRELEGRSHEEIAEVLGVTKGSARQHLMRARVAVRGAVTAITPYPLIARLAETLTAGGGGAGWADAAVGAGAGATLAKLTAGVAATGALVGGAVGGSHVVHQGGGAEAGAAVTRKVAAEPKRVVKAGAASAVAVTPAAVTPVDEPAPKQATRGPERRAPKEQDHRSPARRDAPQPSPSPSSTTGPGDDDRTAHRGHGRDDGRSGRDNGDDTTRHGSRSSGKDDHSGSSGRHRGRDHDGKHGSTDEPTAGSHSESSGKGRDKHESDDATAPATAPATPGDETSGSGSSGSGSDAGGSTDSDDSDSSGSGSGSGKAKPTEPTGTDDVTPSGTTTGG
jgi:RNA polymerase sigma factor (sigma-70 family)